MDEPEIKPEPSEAPASGTPESEVPVPVNPTPGNREWIRPLGIFWLLFIVSFACWKCVRSDHEASAGSNPAAVIQMGTPLAQISPVWVEPKHFSPMDEPPAGDQDPSAHSLRIVLLPNAPGPVRVSVLDGNNREIKLIYNGNLQAGRWAFEWDGLDAQGHHAKPGKYRIHVKTWEGEYDKVVGISEPRKP